MSTASQGDRLIPGPAAVAALLADLADDDATATGSTATHGGAVPVTATDPLRGRLLAASRARSQGARAPGDAELPAAARPYAAQLLALAQVLRHPGAPFVAEVVHGWDTGQTLGHLFAVDALAATALGIGTPPQTGTGATVEGRTASVHALYADVPLADVVAPWQAQAVALLRHAQAGGEARLAEPVSYMTMTLSAGDVYLDRAFETWVHTEDLREVLGLPPASPATEHVSLLTDIGARFLHRGLEADLPEPVLLELTGPGGGRWAISTAGARRLDPAAGLGVVPRARLSMDAVLFCHVVGGRRARNVRRPGPGPGAAGREREPVPAVAGRPRSGSAARRAVRGPDPPGRGARRTLADDVPATSLAVLAGSDRVPAERALVPADPSPRDPPDEGALQRDERRERQRDTHE
jgi:hypothetical protein